MSNYFGETLRRLLDYHGKTAQDLCRAKGYITSHMSQMMRKKQRFIYKEDASKIASFFPAPHDQAELLMARLLDECEGPGSQLIEITLRHRPRGRNKQAAVRRRKMAPDLTKALDALGEKATDDAAVRDLILMLAKTHAKP